MKDDLQAIKYENVAFQAQRDVYQAQLQGCQDTITHLRTRYLDYARVPGKDSVIIIVRKHTASVNDKFHDLPYYITKMQWRHCKNSGNNSNSIHAFNRFEGEGHAEQKCNHVRLINFTREDL